MNIIDLLRQDGITAKKVSGTKGGEFASPCPSCGGTDRFRSWPGQGKGGKWWCRQCGKSGDCIEYLKEIKGKTYREACALLGVEEVSTRWTPIRNRKPKSSKEAWKPKKIASPETSWISRASSLLEWAEGQLHSGKFETEIDRLGKRGIHRETIKNSRLGWNPTEVWVSRDRFGLPEELKDNGKPKKVWVPEGLVIPCFRDGALKRIKIRQPQNDPKYVLLSGSAVCSMILGDHPKTVIVVESELDAILVHQEAYDLVTLIATGSANIRPDAEAADILKNAEHVLISLDYDEAGGRESWKWWLQNFPNAKRWPVPRGKDPSEAYQNGLDIRTWIMAGIAPKLESQGGGIEEIETVQASLGAGPGPGAEIEKDFQTDCAIHVDESSGMPPGEETTAISNTPHRGKSFEASPADHDRKGQLLEETLEDNDDLATYLLENMQGDGFYLRYWPNVRTFCHKILPAPDFHSLDSIYRARAAKTRPRSSNQDRPKCAWCAKFKPIGSKEAGCPKPGSGISLRSLMECQDFVEQKKAGAGVICGGCINFRPGHGAPEALGQCLDVPWDGNSGQWPFQKHPCERFAMKTIH